MTIVLNIPGLGGSGPGHWQTHWERVHANCRRVELPNWNIPDRDSWVRALDEQVRALDEPPVLVAHSLGCATVLHWAQQFRDTPVLGAILVAPADVDDIDVIPAEAREFAPMPMLPLPFPATVLASSNDPYLKVTRAQALATAWGADFENLGPLGHVNADSHLDAWGVGWAYVEDLLQGHAADARQRQS